MQRLAISKLIELINEGTLRVDDKGNIWRTFKNGTEKPCNILTSDGYKRISVKINGKNVFVMQHRLLFAYYYGLNLLDDEMTIHHIDNDKLNNQKGNLLQVTKASNASESTNRKYKETREENEKRNPLVCNLRSLLNDRGLKSNYIAQKINVTSQTLSSWCNNYHYIPMDKAFTLAILLGVKVDDLYGQKES